MIWVLLAVVVVLLVVLGAALARQRRSRMLRRDFGPEYERVVAQHGDQQVAEQELAGRRQRLEQFEIRPLDAGARHRYSEHWASVQRVFVDDPSGAVGQADVLVGQVMNDRGYPVDEDFDQRAADISVRHPDLVQNYRAAHEISIAAGNGQATTEQLRESMVRYRALFEDLLAPDDSRQSGQPRPATAGERVDQNAVAQDPVRR
jgi:hypothetical protein